MGKKKKDKSPSSTIALNKKARHDYFIDDSIEAGIEGLESSLEGPTGLVHTVEDAALPARLLNDFAKAADGTGRGANGEMYIPPETFSTWPVT